MKKISEMTPGEALTEQALAVFKRRLEQARKTPEMAVRVRLPEMRQHSRGTRPTQGQRRRLLHPMYRAHGQPPPEPDTRR